MPAWWQRKCVCGASDELEAAPRGEPRYRWPATETRRSAEVGTAPEMRRAAEMHSPAYVRAAAEASAAYGMRNPATITGFPRLLPNSSQNRNDTVLKSVLNIPGRAA